jgi:hypothetical protein
MQSSANYTHPFIPRPPIRDNYTHPFIPRPPIGDNYTHPFPFTFFYLKLKKFFTERFLDNPHDSVRYSRNRSDTPHTNSSISLNVSDIRHLSPNAFEYEGT